MGNKLIKKRNGTSKAFHCVLWLILW